MADDQYQTKDRIFQVAAELISRKGFARVSMREISEAAGVSKPMLYYYFESKEGLLRALLVESKNQMDAAKREILAQDIPLSERLRQTIAADFRIAVERPELFRLYMEVFSNLDRYPEVAGYLRERIVADTAIEDFIRQGQAEGVFRDDVDPAAAAGVFHGTVGFFLGQSIHGTGVNLSDDLATTVFAVFLEGMGARPASTEVIAQQAGKE